MSESAGPNRITYRVPEKESAPRRRPLTPDDDAPETPPLRKKKSRNASIEELAPLLSICDPLFERICLYSHAMQNGVAIPFASARREIEEIFEQIRSEAHSNPKTAGLFDPALEQSLMFFVDNFFAECGQLPIASDWGHKRMAFELQPANYVGDQDFFRNLDATLRDRTEGATQRLAVYYTCIGLGMTGIYASQPQMLRRKQQEILQRVKDLLETGSRKRLCPAAYEGINTENLIEPPIKPPVLITIIFIGVLFVMVLVYIITYFASTWRLSDILKDIIRS